MFGFDKRLTLFAWANILDSGCFANLLSSFEDCLGAAIFKTIDINYRNKNVPEMGIRREHASIWIS